MFKEEIKYFFKLLLRKKLNNTKLPSILDDKLTNSLALEIKD